MEEEGGEDDDDEEEDDSSGLRLAGADNCGRMGTPEGGRRLRILCLRLASISAAPLNLGTKGIRMGPGGTFPEASGAEKVPVVIGTLESEEASLIVISMSGFLGMSALRGEAEAGIRGVTSLSAGGDDGMLIGRGCDADLLIDALDELSRDCRFPDTLIPRAPVLPGPRMVVVYLRPVAPGKPAVRPWRVGTASSSLGVGLLGIDNSGHRSISAMPESTTYGFERYAGSSEINLALYGSSTFRKYCSLIL